MNQNQFGGLHRLSVCRHCFYLFIHTISVSQRILHHSSQSEHALFLHSFSRCRFAYGFHTSTHWSISHTPRHTGASATHLHALEHQSHTHTNTPRHPGASATHLDTLEHQLHTSTLWSISHTPRPTGASATNLGTLEHQPHTSTH